MLVKFEKAQHQKWKGKYYGILNGTRLTARVRQFVLNGQGVEIAIDWIYGLPDKDSTTPIVLWVQNASNNELIQFSFRIVPGIAGHSSNDYIKNFVHFCKQSGFRTVVYNWPGCDNKLTVRVTWHLLTGVCWLTLMIRNRTCGLWGTQRTWSWLSITFTRTVLAHWWVGLIRLWVTALITRIGSVRRLFTGWQSSASIFGRGRAQHTVQVSDRSQHRLRCVWG